MVRQVTFKGATLQIESVGNYYARNSYRATLISGEWPTDFELITLCDGDVPDYTKPRNGCYHFGGTVSKRTTAPNAGEATSPVAAGEAALPVADVDVYID